MSRARRSFWWSAGFVVLLAFVGLAGQLWVDHKLVKFFAGFSQDTSAMWGRVRAMGLRKQLGQAGAMEAEMLNVTTRLVRRGCDGSLRIGVGARVELERFKINTRYSPEETVSLGGQRVCFDAIARNVFDLRLAFRQGQDLALEGLCGPTVSGAVVDWEPGRALGGKVGLHDRSSCLKKLALLAPRYPNELVPEHVELAFDSRQVDMKRRKIESRTGAGILAEVSNRLSGADAHVALSFNTVGQRRVAACFRKKQDRGFSSFEIELGAAPPTLAALTAPFLTEDNRELLRILRTDQAKCDGTGSGLSFTSDLRRVRLQGKELPRLFQTSVTPAGLARRTCEPGSVAPCSYEFGIIQFNEDGGLLEERQLRAAVEDLSSEGQPSPLLLLYLHGWRHSAHPGDGDLFKFEDLIQRLAQREQKKKSPRRVVGLFLGWPGRLYDSVPANKLATFWNRLQVARKLGAELSDLSRALGALHLAAHQTEESVLANVVVLAHSMGAEALWEALVRQSESSPVADLALFINPAVSVARFEAGRNLARLSKTPLLVYGGVSDQITRQLYPLGKALTAPGTHPDDLTPHTTTITNHHEFITHRLRLENDGRPFDVGAAGEAMPVDAPHLPSSVTVCEHRLGQSIRASCSSNKRVDPASLRKAVIAVDEDIIPSHATFFTEPFVHHLMDLLNLHEFTHEKGPDAASEASTPVSQGGTLATGLSSLPQNAPPPPPR